MISKFIYIITFCLAVQCVNAQLDDTLRVDDIYTDAELVQDVFLKGFCSNIASINLVGVDWSVGHFYNGDVVLGIKEGLIISTGNIADAEGPNVAGNTTAILGSFEDGDLQSIATSGVYDPSGLEFEFVPLGNRVSFRYVFASEEYCEYVGDGFNDVFGFFVSGPGIFGPYSNQGINVAKVPNTNQAVAINSINHIINSEFYKKNELRIDAEGCSINFSPLYPRAFEYDGYTVPLVAEFDVIPCETYKIRLVISDVLDPILDSAVFLAMKSFDIGGNVKVTAISEFSDQPIAAEGCANGAFKFERIRSGTNAEQTFEFMISPNSTAINGIDIEEFPTSITFEPNEFEKIIPVNVIFDNESEDQETFALEIDYGCECKDLEQAVLYINDGDRMAAEFPSIEVCANQEFPLSPQILGGAPPYSYIWNNGSKADTLLATISTPTQFDVMITDQCGNQTFAAVDVSLTSLPEAVIDGQAEVCDGVIDSVAVTFQGNAPWSFSYAKDGDQQDSYSNIVTNPFYLPVKEEGDYTLLTFSDEYCSGNILGLARVEETAFAITKQVIMPLCSNTSDGSIAIQIQNMNTPHEITWSDESISGVGGEELLAGRYGVRIEDSKGCLYNEIINLDSRNDDDPLCKELNIFIPNSFSPNNDNNNDKFEVFLQDEPGIVMVKEFNVYDRWGSIVFQKKSFSSFENDTGWIGEMNGKKLQPGLYSYLIVLLMNNGEDRNLSGDITLIR